ncbi:PRC-barrel domain-containing protein [Piscinibacter sp. Jin2]|uniref:PRC-barrel domain-containing protein n=1 Tax=Aquariibacter lacus TaxID=2801332 RepID=A0A9X0XCM2_9BURK|nr:PRC-barrel domain-containing protein [Piscinibacter lacus]MBL0719395.1 PRC-barrel domain-containing protein [Piscinibacter lacus]
MKRTLSRLSLATLIVAGAFGSMAPATAQVAGGSTSVDVSVSESTRLAMGWSVKKTLLGKTIYNDTGQKVGKVEDLIIAPDRNVSYVIVGAGGFVGIGRHDVAVPVSQIQDRAGKLVMAGATPDTIKGMPVFTYASDNTKRDAFIDAADKDIAKGRAALVTLDKRAAASLAEARAKIDVEITALQADVRGAEGKLAALKQASEARWHDFEAEVNAATARLRKTIDRALG